MKSFRYYVCGLNIGDENYTVKAVVAVQPNGDRYYDHKLSEIEKGKLLSILPTIQKAGIENKLPSSLGKDKRLFSILQTDCSKVVDENGYKKENGEYFLLSFLLRPSGCPKERDNITLHSRCKYTHNLECWDSSIISYSLILNVLQFKR